MKLLVLQFPHKIQVYGPKNLKAVTLAHLNVAFMMAISIDRYVFHVYSPFVYWLQILIQPGFKLDRHPWRETKAVSGRIVTTILSVVISISHLVTFVKLYYYISIIIMFVFSCRRGKEAFIASIVRDA